MKSRATPHSLFPHRRPWLGLGCGGFGGSCGSSTAGRILDESYAAGIRYFDTANSYGFGLSERILGNWLKGVERSTVTIATKFGKPVESHHPLRLTVRRNLTQSLKPLWRMLKKPGTRFATEECNRRTINAIDIAELKESVCLSLESLQIEQIDVLHLHSVSPSAVTTEVRDTLKELLESGQVRTLGLATNRSDCATLVESGFPASVVQFPDSACWAHPIRWESDSYETVIAHSVLGRDGALRAAFARWLSGSPRYDEEWSDVIGVSASSKEGIAELLIRGALARNRSGGVLCGVSRVDQVAMLKRVNTSPFAAEQNTKLLATLAQFVIEVTA